MGAYISDFAEMMSCEMIIGSVVSNGICSAGLLSVINTVIMKVGCSNADASSCLLCFVYSRIGSHRDEDSICIGNPEPASKQKVRGWLATMA